MKLVSDNTRYEGGVTLKNGRHYGFRSDHGLCDVYRTLMDVTTGHATESSQDTMSPDEMIELAAAMTMCARAATNFHAEVHRRLLAAESDGEA